MVFRRIYWVVEEIRSGESRVAGVFTSLPDLQDRYLEVVEPRPDGLRVTLIQADRKDGILGQWASPHFADMEADLAPIVGSQEITDDQASQGAGALRARFS